MQRKRLSVLTAALLIMTSLILAGLMSVVPSTATPKARAASWTQIWGDEFNGSGGSGLDTGNWLYDTGTSYPGGAGNWGTGEVETMTNSTSNVFQDGSGHLVIKAINNGGSWTSGRVETQNTSFAAPAGGELAVEASIQQPNVSGSAGLGYWPAFWMLGSAFRGNYNNWPGIGEVDIMEDVNGLSSEYGTLHCGVDPGGPCKETNGLSSGQHACSGCQTGYHTYRIEIDRSVSPEQIRWYLDGSNFFTISANQMDATTWTNAVDHSFFIIFDLAIGGGFPNGVCGCSTPTSATASGASLNVDYVHVFTSGSSAPTPTPTPSSGGCTSGNFAVGVVNASSTSALPWFQPCGWSAGYVILHYITPNISQQNVYTSYNSSTARWEYTVSNLNSGQVLQYSYTYQQNGLQYDTGWYSWTHP